MWDICVKKCLRREKNYVVDSELCLTKCFDLAFIYIRVGLSEINEFKEENRIVDWILKSYYNYKYEFIRPEEC